MPNSALEHLGRGKTGRKLLQDEKHVPNRAAGKGALRASGELRRRKGVGRFADEDLPYESESFN